MVKKEKLLVAGVLFIAVLFFGLLAVFLGQDANWDLRNYHYYNAYAFLNDRYALDLLPSQMPYFYNPLIDVPFFYLSLALSAKQTAFALGAVQGINFVLLFFIAFSVLAIKNNLHKAVVSFLIAFLGMIGSGSLAQLGTVFGDNITSIGVFLSLLLVVRYYKLLYQSSVFHAVVFSMLFALPAGMAFGLKLPSVIYAVGLCFGLLFAGYTPSALRKNERLRCRKSLKYSRYSCETCSSHSSHFCLVSQFYIRSKRRFLVSFTFGIGVLIGAAITFAHWGIFLYHNFDSPLFPYFNNIFQSSFAPLSSARDTQFIPKSASDFFLMPFLFTIEPLRVGEIPWRDFRIVIFYALFLLVLFCKFFKKCKSTHRNITLPFQANYVLAVFAISYIAWLFLFSIYRYAVPIEMIAGLLIVIVVDFLPLKKIAKLSLIGVLFIVVCASIIPGNWDRRSSWLERVVEIEFDSSSSQLFASPLNTVVLMAGWEPYSHVIPLFPKETAFVRIQSNFSLPDKPHGINEILHDRIQNHKNLNGRFYSLIPEHQLDVMEEALSNFNLALDRSSCSNVIDKLFNNSVLVLCGLKIM
ncbi:MAG: hypothetical protein FWE93_04765 [Alphaproteobacteria bacterium]|nr:hypothetical protein [Alphaproteobacteria bacterium]